MPADGAHPAPSPRPAIPAAPVLIGGAEAHRANSDFDAQVAALLETARSIPVLAKAYAVSIAEADAAKAREVEEAAEHFDLATTSQTIRDLFARPTEKQAVRS